LDKECSSADNAGGKELEKTKHGMLIALEKNVEFLAGETISNKVMQGSEEITEKTDKKKIAKWVKDAMGRLDALVDEKTRGPNHGELWL
jgi:hypothetical protein